MCPSLPFCHVSPAWHDLWPGLWNHQGTLEMSFPSLWTGKQRQILSSRVREIRLNEGLGS